MIRLQKDINGLILYGNASYVAELFGSGHGSFLMVSYLDCCIFGQLTYSYYEYINDRFRHYKFSQNILHSSVLVSLIAHSPPSVLFSYSSPSDPSSSDVLVLLLIVGGSSCPRAANLGFFITPRVYVGKL